MNNRRVFEILQFPRNFSRLALAAWYSMEDYSLYEIDGKLVMTDSLEDCLADNQEVCFIRQEYESLAAFELALLEMVADWCLENDDMIAVLDAHLRLV